MEDYYRQLKIPDRIVTTLRHMLVRQFDDLRAAALAYEARLRSGEDVKPVMSPV